MTKIEQLKTLPLWVRLVIYFLLLSIIILLLFQIIFNYSLQRHLQTYIRGREEVLNHQIVSSLSEYYQATGSWAGVQMPLLHAALSTNTRLLLYNASGQLIGDTGQRRRHMMMVREQAPDLDNVRAYQFKIELDTNVVGELIIAHPITEASSVWLQQDLIFRRALTRSLFWTGLAAISAALFLGIVFSRRLSRPLEEITTATASITRGDYRHQLPSYQSKELDGLAQYINQLAAHLHELERLRKRSVADIAHELRTPLSTLRSYVEAVQDGVMPADDATLNILKEEITHLTNVATDLDELTRAENARDNHLNRETINMNQFLNDKVNSLKPRFHDKGVKLALSVPEKIIYSKQDSTVLRKIMGNLLDNAFRYTEPGGTVEVYLQDNPVEIDPFAVAPLGQDVTARDLSEKIIDDKFLIKVSDTGIGIKEEYLPYIFERFFRTDSSREREQSKAGSGIGLALVKELTRAAGGFILVNSRPVEGTVFYLYLRK